MPVEISCGAGVAETDQPTAIRRRKIGYGRASAVAMALVRGGDPCGGCWPRAVTARRPPPTRGIRANARA